MTAKTTAISASTIQSDRSLFSLLSDRLHRYGFYACSDSLSGKYPAEIARGVHVEHDDFEPVLAAEREGREVHDLEPPGEHLLEGDLVELHGGGVLLRIGRVDAVHARALQQDVASISMPRSAAAESVVK